MFWGTNIRLYPVFRHRAYGLGTNIRLYPDFGNRYLLFGGQTYGFTPVLDTGAYFLGGQVLELRFLLNHKTLSPFFVEIATCTPSWSYISVG